VQTEKDFELMYHDKVNMMFEKWPQLTPRVLSLVKQTVKDKSLQRIRGLADDDAEIGTCHFTVCMLYVVFANRCRVIDCKDSLHYTVDALREFI